MKRIIFQLSTHLDFKGEKNRNTICELKLGKMSYQQPYQQQNQYQQGQYQQQQPFQYQQPYQQQPPTVQQYPPPASHQQQHQVYPLPPQPAYQNSTDSKHNPIVEKAKWKDLWAVILWLVFLAGYIYFASVCIPISKNDLTQGNATIFGNNGGSGSSVNSSSNSPLVNISTTEFGRVVGFACLAGVVMSVIWFTLMLLMPGFMIHMSYIGMIIVTALAAAYYVYIRQYIAAVIFFVFTILMCFFYWSVRKRIPFAKLMLEHATRVILRYSGTLVAAFIGLVIAAIFNLTWILTLIGGRHWAENNSISSGATIAIGIFLVFVLYWTNEIIRNTVHVTVSGTFATYYFTGVQQPGSKVASVPVRAVTSKAAGRALTTSFGPVCFGSLLIAAIETLRFIVNIAANDAAQDGNIICCIVLSCLECILACFENLLEYFNKYAFTQVAIYGKGYCEAAKDTFTLFKQTGLDALVNDSLIGAVLSFGSIIVALVCALVGFLYVKASEVISQDTSVYVTVCIISGLIGMWLFLIVTEPISSGVASTFVCLSMQPDVLQRQQPELFEKIRMTWPQIDWNRQGYY